MRAINPVMIRMINEMERSKTTLLSENAGATEMFKVANKDDQVHGEQVKLL
jgi:hypothetical protein